MAKNKTIINAYAKIYIEEIFSKTLQAEGFSCPDEKMLCWYRLRNGEILDTVVFCSKWTSLPLLLDIYYESIPLFIEPFRIQNVNYNAHSFDRGDCSKRRAILEGDNINGASLTLYRCDVWVDAPAHGNRGLYTLTHKILPYFQNIETAYDCYLSHKETYLKGDPANRYYGGMSLEFITEALFFNDEEMLPFCRERIPSAFKTLEREMGYSPKNQELKKMQVNWQRLSDAFFDGKRDEYLEYLRQLEIQNIQKLQKRFGLKISGQRTGDGLREP